MHGELSQHLVLFIHTSDQRILIEDLRKSTQMF